MEETAQLIYECQQDNRVAQKQLYEQHAEVMLGVCLRYTKSISDAEDVMQEGFIKVFKTLAQFRHEGNLGGWIRRIMVNTALNYLRKNKRYKDQMQFAEIHESTLAKSEEPAMAIETKELVALIQQLPSGSQTIFNLYAIEGFTHVQIAKLLSIAEGTSRSQYARARGMMIALINNYYSSNKATNYAEK